MAFLFLVILFSTSLFSQTETSIKNASTNYRLDLPEEWKKPKLLSTINEILSKTVDELKDRSFITEGIAEYIVQPVIESVHINNAQSSSGAGGSYSISYSFSFFAAFRVYDSSGKAITQLVLVGPGEKFDYNQKNPSSSSQPIMYEDRTIYDSSGKAAVGTIRTRMADPVMKDFQRSDVASRPPLDFLMDICVTRIYEIRKKLKKLAEQ